MIEKRNEYILCVMGIASLLVLSISAWLSFRQYSPTDAASPSTTVFLDTSSNNTIAVKTANDNGTISYTITDFNGNQVSR